MTLRCTEVKTLSIPSRHKTIFYFSVLPLRNRAYLLSRRMALLRSSHGAAASAVALAVLGITMIALGQCRAAARGPHALRRGSLSRARLRGAACPGDGLSHPHPRVVCILQVSAARRGMS